MCGPGKRRNNTACAKTMTAGILWVFAMDESTQSWATSIFSIMGGSFTGHLLVSLDQILNRYTLLTIIFRSPVLPHPSFSTILIFHIETRTRIN